MPQLDDVTDSPLPNLAPRPPASHKGDFGRALVVGGSRGMSGAIALAGKATLRSGAGLVTLAVPETIQHVVAAFEPSYMTRGLADQAGQLAAPAADVVQQLAESATVLAVGPGFGRSPNLADLLAKIYTQIDRPMVVDADGLFALAERPDALAGPAGPRLLTPHPGEFARLAGKPPADAKAIAAADDRDRAQAAAELARRARAVVVLKGHRTVVTDGRRVTFNPTGNPGMATGGTGDVLTGVITGLVCQDLPPFEAARLGVHVHGLAGDLALEEFGQISMIASDLLDYLPAAFQATQAVTPP